MAICKRFFPIALCAAMILMLLPDIALADSVAPPSFIIIVSGAPDDLTIEMESDNKLERVSKKVVAWETYYAFYNAGLPSALNVRTNKDSYTIPLDKFNRDYKHYDDVYMLDLTTRTLSKSALPLRSALLIALRVALTLLIEGAVFFKFGFRKKSSWALFVIINLITQGLLNWVLSDANSIFNFDIYRMITLVVLEVLVLVVEIPLFTVLVKEHTAGYRALYAVSANIASFIAGGFIIMMLPI
jgi:hypothetical protein